MKVNKKTLIICFIIVAFIFGGITGVSILHADNVPSDPTVDNTSPSASFSISKKKKADIALLYDSSNGTDSDVASKTKANITDQLTNSGVDANVMLKNIAKNEDGEPEIKYYTDCYGEVTAYIKNDGTVWIKYNLMYIDSSNVTQVSNSNGFVKIGVANAKHILSVKTCYDNDGYTIVPNIIVERNDGSTIGGKINNLREISSLHNVKIIFNSYCVTDDNKLEEITSGSDLGGNITFSFKDTGISNVKKVVQGSMVLTTNGNVYITHDAKMTSATLAYTSKYWGGGNNDLYKLNVSGIDDIAREYIGQQDPGRNYNLDTYTSYTFLKNGQLYYMGMPNKYAHTDFNGAYVFGSYYNTTFTPMQSDNYISSKDSSHYFNDVSKILDCFGQVFKRSNNTTVYMYNTEHNANILDYDAVSLAVDTSSWSLYGGSTGLGYTPVENALLVYNDSNTLHVIKTSINTVETNKTKDTVSTQDVGKLDILCSKDDTVTPISQVLNSINWRENSTHFIVDLTKDVFNTVDNKDETKIIRFSQYQALFSNMNYNSPTIPLSELSNYDSFKINTWYKSLTLRLGVSSPNSWCASGTNYLPNTKYAISKLLKDIDNIKSSWGVSTITGLQWLDAQDSAGTLFYDIELDLYKNAATNIASITSPENLSYMENKNIYFVGATCKDKVNSLIQQLDNRGTYIEHSTIDSDLQRSQAYIMSILNQQQDNSNIFLVGDEVDYKETYKDANNDRKNDELWSYIQDDKHLNYDNDFVQCNKTGDLTMDNSLGTADFATGQWMHTRVTKFDKPGKYKVSLKVQDNPTASSDNPSGDSNFSNQNKWSTDDNSVIINVNRKPIAVFTAYATANTSKGNFDVTIRDEDKSYDPDHQATDETRKGIVNKKFQWKEVTAGTTDTWHDGKLPSIQEPNKDFLVKLTVEDLEGEMSDPLIKYVTTKNENLPPVAQFTENETTMPVDQLNNDAAPAGDYLNDRSDVTFTDQSYDPNNDSIEEKWTVTDSNGNTVYTSSTKPTANTFYGKPLGTYTISLVCDDGPTPHVGVPLTSEPYTQQLTLVPINHKPVAHFSVYNPTGEPENIKINEDSTDPDNDPIDTKDWAVTDSSGNIVQETQNKLPDFTQLDGTYTLTLKVKDNPKVPPELWSNPYSQTITIENLKITGTLYPNPAKQGQQITLDITTHGKAKYLRAYFPEDITSRDKRSTSFPIQKQIVEEDVHNEKMPYILPLDTPLTLDSNGNRLRPPYSIIVEAEKVSGLKKSITLYLDVKGNVLDGVKSVNVDDDNSN